MDMIIKTFQGLIETSGVALLLQDPRSFIMIGISCILLYLAIVKKYEPLLLVPIAFDMLLTNLSLGSIMEGPKYLYLAESIYNGTKGIPVTMADGTVMYQYLQETGGLLYYLYQGVKLGVFPPLIFLGVGAMTDFGPLIANPKSLFLGAAAQLGIFLTFIGARVLGFTGAEAGSIGIIGGADGPTAIYLTGKLAPHLLGPIAVAAYSYMALVPVIQPPIMRLLTTKKEREIVMDQLRPVSKSEKIVFPIMVTIVVALLLPSALPLVGTLMLGNLFRESLVVDRLSKTAQNELMNIVTIFLGLTVGATAKAETFLTFETIKIIVLGVVAFGFGTAGGVLLGKVMNKLSVGKINPLIGSAGVSAVPMAARVSQVEGQKANPKNFLLMHAMGPNVAGVIGSAIAAGVLLSIFG
ncbi:MAG: sodium ion-translocating decarboxylase subunit beta [Christensenellaceae bacterium]|nr:sodium ion-translocating decarboxylase subunit beta [Christensenellaceae bacterium]